MADYAYERIKIGDNRYRFRRQKAISFSDGCKKSFVQLYSLSGAYIDATPQINKELKDSYLDEELEGRYSIEPCQFVRCKYRKNYFKRGKMSGEGSVRYWMSGKSVPQLIKRSLKVFAYAVANNNVTASVEMRLIHDIDRLDDKVGQNIPELIEGAVWYIDKHVIPRDNVYRTPTLIETLKDRLEKLVLNTRFYS